MHLSLTRAEDSIRLYRLVKANPYLHQFEPWTRDFDLRDALLLTNRTATDTLRGDTLEYSILEGLSATATPRDPIQGIVRLYSRDDETRSAWVGYLLDERAQGKHFARRAVHATVKYAQESWGIGEVHAEIAQANERSQHLIAKLAETIGAGLELSDCPSFGENDSKIWSLALPATIPALER